MIYFLRTILISAFFIGILSPVYADTINLIVEPKAQVKLNNKAELTPVVFVNEPFRLTVKIESSGRSSPGTATIKGLDQFTMQGQQQENSFSVINGKLSAQLMQHCQLIAKTEGSYILGPATITLQGKEYESAPVTVTVIKKPADFQQKAMMESGVDVIPSLEASKNQLVIGEQCVVTLLIKHYGKIINMGAENPTFKGFSSKALPDEQLPSETINGHTYHVLRRRFLLTPLQEGKKTIDPATIIYHYHAANRHRSPRSAAFFSDLFDELGGGNLEQQRVTSGELSLNVSAVPQSTKNYSGVGSFETFSVKLDRLTAYAHEPLTLTAEIDGLGNFEQITAPRLTLLAGWKAYESNSSIHEESITTEGQRGKKTFEFVLQIPRAGTFDVPAQSFRWYDPRVHDFKELCSQPITVTILPQPQSEKSDRQKKADSLENSMQESSEKKQLSNDKHGSQGEDIHFIMIDDDANKPFSALHWWVFMLILLAPLIAISRIAFKTIQAFMQTPQDIINRHVKIINQAIEAENIPALYEQFKTLLALRFQQHATTMTHDTLARLLINDGIAPDKVDEFLDFLNECARFHFLQDNKNSLERKDIIKKSSYWIVFLTT